MLSEHGFIKNILDWYSEFNAVRNKKYKEFGLIPDNSENDKETIYFSPSTGILGNNPYNVSDVMDVLAVIPAKDSQVKIEQINGTKQKSPFWYSSAFSRADRICEPNITTILISGTASIDEKGNTVYEGNSKMQILKTFEVVEDLIVKEGASFKDISSATVFLKRGRRLFNLSKNIGRKEHR